MLIIKLLYTHLQLVAKIEHVNSFVKQMLLKIV